MASWQVPDAQAAADLLNSETPDIVLLQAAQTSNWEFCQSLKQQRHRLWCYTILLDERICPEEHTSEEVLLRQVGLTTTALEMGADAYLWFPSSTSADGTAVVDHLNRVLQAHIRNAFRRNQAYRELSQANDLLSAIALVDPLTQLGNRRAFDWELPRQIQVTREQNHPLSLLIIDIDFFKQVNDEHGHLVGDQVLRMFADRLRHHMRFYETPFRYGGEEFVVLLQNTTAADAEQLAERLRRLINDTPFVISKRLDLPLTISIGVSTLATTDDEHGEELIRRADENLLQAKRTGRNRVIMG
ncbi:GGDEF domain-containing protein [Halomicronema sp. CCY15110]|uniref:GGDEF domain-containing protein n=1 Tax=Halomicronema sp. CCY15110 TaxID=2767773 RepID=UPI00194F637C|nr:GGDEF domain-containing protein [Halomicronema sp. CCY15110]